MRLRDVSGGASEPLSAPIERVSVCKRANPRWKDETFRSGRHSCTTHQLSPFSSMLRTCSFSQANLLVLPNLLVVILGGSFGSFLFVQDKLLSFLYIVVL